MRYPFEFADDLGPGKIIHVHEPSLGLKATLVVDNVARGASLTRRFAYTDCRIRKNGLPVRPNPLGSIQHP